jgi:alkylation response protein AidB-like acyl-CoA dehydrogenase
LDLRFTAAERAFRDELRSWFPANLARPWSAELRDPANDEDRLVEIRRRFQRKLCDAGYLGLDWPREFGGQGRSIVDRVIFQEEFVRADAPPLPNFIGVQMLAPALIHHGSEAQRERFIPPMLRAEEIWCQGFSEPGAGSDLAALQCSATPDGDDYRITGQKVWTTMGPWADWTFLLARTDAGDRYGGITFFLLPLDQPGVAVRPLRQLTGDAEFGEVFFDGALARREHIVGRPGEGWKIANTVLAYERGVYEIEGPARNDRLLADLAAGLIESGAIARSDVRQRLGRLFVENEVIRAGSLRILAGLSQGESPGEEASIQKLNWSEYARRQGEAAFDLLGPQAHLATRAAGARAAVDWGYEHLFSLSGPIAGGSSEIQRNIIAKRALGLPTR